MNSILYIYKIYGYTLKGENNIVIKILRCFNLFLAFIPSEVLVSININWDIIQDVDYIYSKRHYHNMIVNKIYGE